MTTSFPKRTALSAAAILFLAVATSAGLAHATEDETATYSGAACQPTSGASSFIYGNSYLRNSSTTTAYNVVCPITRHIPLTRSPGVGARVWARRGGETTVKINCTLRLHNAAGDLLESIPKSSTATGAVILDLMNSNQYATWGVGPLGNQGETLTIACSVPANSYIYSYETYSM
jgi:hypothetical protein